MKNNYEFRGDHYAIFIRRRKYPDLTVLVDVGDFQKVSSINGCWAPVKARQKSCFYAVSNCYEIVEGRQQRVKGSCQLMHRMIMDASEPSEVDHVRRDQTLDNRRSNLRIATRRQNALNSGRACAKEINGKWRIEVTFRGKTYFLGSYESRNEADLIRLGAVMLADRMEAEDHNTTALADFSGQLIEARNEVER